MTYLSLKDKRDAAWRAYLATRLAGGRSPYKLAAVINATRKWYRAALARREKSA